MHAICHLRPPPQNYSQSFAALSGLRSVPGVTFGAWTVQYPLTLLGIFALKWLIAFSSHFERESVCRYGLLVLFFCCCCFWPVYILTLFPQHFCWPGPRSLFFPKRKLHWWGSSLLVPPSMYICQTKTKRPPETPAIIDACEQTLRAKKFFETVSTLLICKKKWKMRWTQETRTPQQRTCRIGDCSEALAQEAFYTFSLTHLTVHKGVKCPGFEPTLLVLTWLDLCLTGGRSSLYSPICERKTRTPVSRNMDLNCGDRRQKSASLLCCGAAGAPRGVTREINTSSDHVTPSPHVTSTINGSTQTGWGWQGHSYRR